MTLVEHLENTGIQLGQKVGFIIETHNSLDGWVPSHARIGKVLTDIPDGSQDQEEVQDFDPEFDLLVLWQAGHKNNLYLLRAPDGSSVYSMDPSGLVIDKKGVRIIVAQSDVFMDLVCDIMCALAQ
jgi:hypothetical protein